ncbi:hypothetical protein FRB90_003464 [Tulasnella sp. 427]|nr:hypothetical protein FRB90_003464 [Tulasnella sp. 427]
MSTRPPPPSGAPPPYAFVARVYRRSLRPIVMGCALIAIFWSWIWGISALLGIKNAEDLKPINIALGVLYLTVGFIELFGFLAAMKSNIRLVRIYTYLSILAAVIVLAAESVRFSVYFTHKKSLIDNCTTDATGATVEVYSGFWSGRHSVDTLSAADAAEYCNDSWQRSVWSSIAWLVISTLLGWFFVSIAFSYYYQLLMPQPVMAPSQAFQLRTYNPQGGYNYPAPPGPPPRDDFVPPYDPAKLPQYGQEGGYSQQQYGAGGDKRGLTDESTDDVRLESAPQPQSGPRNV